MIGVVIGKFYPPHRGHKHLIDTAAAQVDQLTVIVCEHPSQILSGAQRAEWLREIHPGVNVVVTPDDEPDEPGPWARRTIQILGRTPDVVFTSELYGENYAAALGCRHVLVDLARSSVPISGTQIRADPLDCLDYLEPCVRARFVKRVVLIGVESTGKTTLAEELAHALNTTWVPEYGREFSLHKAGGWETSDFVNISSEQQKLEDRAAREANRVLICDTNALATTVWHRRYMGVYSPEVDAIAFSKEPDLYMLAEPDFPFVQDGTRDGEHIRMEMHEWFLERLKGQFVPVVCLEGKRETRLKRALEAISALANNGAVADRVDHDHQQQKADS